MKVEGPVERIYPGLNLDINSNLYREHAARYEFAAMYTKGKKVLDMACGSGYGSRILCDLGALEVYGCDLAEEGIKFAQRTHACKCAKFQIMDATKITFQNKSFDVVVSFETIEHVLKSHDVIKEFSRVLNDQGTLIISTPNKPLVSGLNTKPKNPFHVKEFTKDEFIAFLSIYFKNIELYSQRLKIDISMEKKIIRHLVLLIVKVDFLKLSVKFAKRRMYSTISNFIDNNSKEYTPIPYQNNHKPMVFIAICRK